MKKHIKRKIAWVLALPMCASVMLVPVSAAETQTEIAPETQQENFAAPSGTCGEMLAWKLEGQVLSISGTGEMDNYSPEDVQAPWKEYGDEITEARIENGVETIGAYAFYGMTQLQKVEISESVRSIGAYAFSGCDVLEAFELPESVTDVAETAFATVQPEESQITQDEVEPETTASEAEPEDSAEPEHKAGTTTVVPETETTAEQESEEIPAQENSVEQEQAPEEAPAQEPAVPGISETDEADSADLVPEKSLEAEDSEQKEIAAYTAEGEIALYSSDSISRGDWTYSVVDGRAYVKSYDGYASSVTIPTSVTLNGVNYKIRSVGEFAFEGNVYLKSVTIPSVITSLERGAFKNCTNLSSVTINGNLGDANGWSTSDWAENYSVFYNAGTNTDGMTVTFGSGVTSVPAYLFATGQGQSDDVYAHVKEIVLSSTVTAIGAYAFYNCYDLTGISAKGLKEIGSYSFVNTSIRKLDLPSNMVAIYEAAFMGCTRLASVTLPKSTTTLGKCAFKNCTNLSSVTINGNLGDADGWSTSDWAENYSVFYNAGTNTDGMTVTFGSGVTWVPAYLFATGQGQSADVYAHVKEIVLSSTVTGIGSYAFYNCYDLTGISAKGLKEIGSYSFVNTNIQKLDLPSNLVAIYEAAFMGCAGLTSVTLPKSMTTLGRCVFKDCVNLSAVTIKGDLGDADGWSTSDWAENYSVFYNAGTYSNGIRVIFSAGVTRIPAYLFATGGKKSEYIYANVKSVYIPYTIRSIGEGAFYNCYGLKELDFRGDRVNIADNAFTGVNTKAYYPQGSRSWSRTYWKNYGGTISWQAKKAYLANVKLAGITPLTTGINVRWEKVSKADGYFVYRRTTNGSWSYIGKTTGTMYKDTTAKRGFTYYYTVRAKSGGNISPSFNSIGMKAKRKS